MSKYIIEIEEKPLCVFDKDTQTFFPRLWRVKGFNSLVFDEEGLSRLEELNSDYINEHYGSLQDDAYKRGINDGSLDVKQRVEGAYQKGFEDGKAVHEKGCEGCEHECENKMTQTCILCCNAYKNRWIAKSDKIEVGDEVKPFYTDITGVVTLIDGDTIYILWRDGSSTSTMKLKEATKTGRHFDIASILEDMRND